MHLLTLKLLKFFSEEVINSMCKNFAIIKLKCASNSGLIK
jgi:hypothetical protein